VYIIAHCSSLNRTTFFSLYVCCPVLDLTYDVPVNQIVPTEANRGLIPNTSLFCAL
jgi:hypothetical protein